VHLVLRLTGQNFIKREQDSTVADTEQAQVLDGVTSLVEAGRLQVDTQQGLDLFVLEATVEQFRRDWLHLVPVD